MLVKVLKILFFISLIFVFSYSLAEPSKILLENYGQFESDIVDAIGNDDGEKALTSLVDLIVKIAFSLGSVLAVILIIWGGVEYIMAESFINKTDGKGKLVRAFGGLAILFFSFVIFNTINPQLTEVNFQKVIAVSGKSSISLECMNFNQEAERDFYSQLRSENSNNFSFSFFESSSSCVASLIRAKKNGYDIDGASTRGTPSCSNFIETKDNCKFERYYYFYKKDR